MRAEIKALHQQLKTTSVYVTHDQIEAMTMADRIVVMHDGVVQQVGPPLELYDRPVNMFVAGFIGSPGMNFLPATVAKGGKVDAVLADGQKLRLPDGLPLKDGDRITVGLRPEHIQLGEDGPLKAEVEVVEPLGLSTQFYVKLAGQQVCVFVMGRSNVRPGDMRAAVGRSGGAASVRSGERQPYRIRAFGQPRKQKRRPKGGVSACSEETDYLILVSLNSTCFLATGSYLRNDSLSVLVRLFLLVT